MLTESLSDEFDVESLLETDESLAWRRDGIGWMWCASCVVAYGPFNSNWTLHGMRTDEARSLRPVLARSPDQGWRCVRVGTRQGPGLTGATTCTEDKVKRWLVQRTRAGFLQARGDEGGAGALVLLLAPTRGNLLPG